MNSSSLLHPANSGKTISARPYAVPSRFGIGALVGVTTAMALLFGALNRLDGEPLSYLFYGSLGLIICLIQMYFGSVPRKASILAGIVVYASFVLIGTVAGWRSDLQTGIQSVVWILSLSRNPRFWLGVASVGLATSFVLKRLGRWPRKASVVAGTFAYAAILLAIIAELRVFGLHAIVLSLILNVAVGALLGYLSGTCAAGIFLVMDYLERSLPGHGDDLDKNPTAGGPI